MVSSMISQGESYFETQHGIFKLGFGKDIIGTTTYKPVWLYNSLEIGLDNATTCEVFDFISNAWRYVTPSAPYRVLGAADPVFVHGSLHWFTACVDTKILSFDLHTEAFQIISKAPFPANSQDNPYAIVLCNIDNRLCVSQMQYSEQVVWSFNSGNKTWDKIFSIDLVMTTVLYDCPTLCAFHPLAVLDGMKNKRKKKKKKNVKEVKERMVKKNLLFYDRVKSQYLLIHDPETDLDDFTFTAESSMGFLVCYFQSLISI